MHVVYYQHFDGLNYSIQEDLIIKHTLLVSSLKMHKRITNSIKMKGLVVATHIPCFLVKTICQHGGQKGGSGAAAILTTFKPFIPFRS